MKMGDSSAFAHQSRHKLLFISSMFPPAGGPGVQRSLYFTKYLPIYDWEPVVLTTQHVTISQRDTSLLAQIPPELRIVKTYTLEPEHGSRSLLQSILHYLVWGILKPLSIPDKGNWWFPWAIPTALRECQTQSIKVIYSTAPPFSSHILSGLLKKKTGLPLVLDYRDDWLLDPILPKLYPFYRSLFLPFERFLQRWVNSQADKIILVTEGSRKNFVDHYGNPERFLTIRNGYEPQDFENAVLPGLNPNKFHLVYTGSTIQFVSRPDVFLRGLREAIESDDLVRKNIQVWFVGEFDPLSKSLVAELDLHEYVKAVGYIPHQESVGYLQQATALLLIMRSAPSHVPGKTYEYMGAKKPIFVLSSTNSEAFRLVDKACLAFVADPENTVKIAKKLVEMVNLWSMKKLQVKPDELFINSFTRKQVAEQLSHVFDAVSQ